MTTLAERLHADFPGSSGRSVKQWLSAGRVRVNAEVVRDPRTLVAPGDRVTLGPGGVDPAHPAVLPLGLAIVHEDRHLVVIDKPPGLLTIATEKERERTAYRLLWDLLGRHRPVARPFIVHRLDRETSGLLVVAKTPGAKTALQTQFAARTVDRGYVAVVEGVMRKDTQTLVDRVEEDAAYRVRIARGGRRGGREAITRYRVRGRGRDATLIDIALGTGRRHQIRVQLAAIGHPVVGDAQHGSRRDPLRRVCLHASVLGFVHPGTGEPARFESPAPPAFLRLVQGV
jgi:23S rRNA pseudouridine1911/1915/1917 synthase